MAKAGKGKRVLIVEARFYPDIADALLAGARAALEKAGVACDVVTVPGALEVAPAIAFAAEGGAYDGFVALGCVIRGATSHYDHVASESIRALQWLSVKKKLAIGTGILTVENRAQAMERASVAKKNKGGSAAKACLALLGIKGRFKD
ncbi:MAG TPA: 6,7-dimethyl-8-ribityllumazine synthase [Sphingomonadales bacterium]|nr:6,7-dimethyl-8-ribityllumazine synthase [Sphingomonadales bacterium]